MKSIGSSSLGSYPPRKNKLFQSAILSISLSSYVLVSLYWLSWKILREGKIEARKRSEDTDGDSGKNSLRGDSRDFLLVQKQGMSIPLAAEIKNEKVRETPFWPNFVFREMIVWLLLLSVICLFQVWKMRNIVRDL